MFFCPLIYSSPSNAGAVLLFIHRWILTWFREQMLYLRLAKLADRVKTGKDYISYTYQHPHPTI